MFLLQGILTEFYSDLFKFLFGDILIIHLNTLDYLLLTWSDVLCIFEIDGVLLQVQEEWWWDFDHTRHKRWLDKLEVEVVLGLV